MHIDLHIIFPVNIRYGPLTLSCSCMQHCTQNREPKVGKHLYARMRTGSSKAIASSAHTAIEPKPAGAEVDEGRG